MRYIPQRMKRFCGFVTGFVFFISGILKLMDPVGAGLVMNSYFDFFHIGFISAAAKFFGVAFALAETIIGTGLITGVWRKAIGISALLLQGFFTVLTLILVIFNPEMDCGCFGEAIHLTHWQTFLKNIVLCLLLVLYFFPAGKLGESRRRKYASFGLVTISTFVFAIYSLQHIPLVDFTDFRPGSALAAGENVQGDVYEALFIYEKDGTQKEFTLGHLPDSTWTFIRTETVLKESADNPAASLSITDASGKYFDHIAAEGQVMVISVYDIRRNRAGWEDTADFMADAAEAGFRPILLVSSTSGQFDTMAADLDTETTDILKRHLYFSDYKTLIALNRSNGGATFFSDGQLIRKWARKALPDKEELSALSHNSETEELISSSTSTKLTFQGFLLYVFAVMLLL